MGAKPVGRGEFLIECSNRGKLPDVIFTLGGHNFSLGPEDYVLKESENICISAFFGNDFPTPGGPFAVFGTVFLRRWYSVFDLEARTISLARAKPADQPGVCQDN
jgi:saccharopepsin